jgi:glutathione S-transferase
MALKLFHFEACPYCEKVRSTLKRMDLKYESVEIDPSDRSGVKAVSGQELVPVLVDGDATIHDSTRILRYLVRTYGGGRFLPDDAHSRGLMWILEEYVDEVLIPLLRRASRAVDAKGNSLDDARKAVLKSESTQQFESLDQLLSSDGFILGGRLCLADIALYACLSRLELYSPRGIPPEYQRIRAWYGRMKA